MVRGVGYTCTISTCPLSLAVISYRPNLGGNSFYMSVFCILLLLQIFFGFRYKTWTFMIGFVLGCLGEIIGYAGRILLYQNPFLMNNFLTYLICLTLAPAFLTASIYLSLGRVIIIRGAQYSRIRPKSYTIIFICFDIIALILQAVGGAIASTAKTSKASNTGVHIMVAGLAWQVVAMTGFMLLWVDFTWRYKKAMKAGYRTEGGDFGKLRDSKKLSTFQTCLAIATVAIYIRSIYRVAELEGGFKGKIANDEPAFMVFEGPFIIVAVSMLTVFHPGRVFDGLWKTAGQAAKGKNYALENRDIFVER